MPITGLVFLYTEVDDSGRVLREIGLNSKKEIIHMCPGKGESNLETYGVFDLVPIQVSPETKDAISKERFEELWGQQAQQGI